MKRLIYTLLPLTPLIALLAGLAMLTACTSQPATPPQTVIKEVPVPYHEPCPKGADKPPVPKHVAEENPVMPKDATQPDGVDWRAVSRILGAKIVELFGYTDRADGIMTACSKP